MRWGVQEAEVNTQKCRRVRPMLEKTQKEVGEMMVSRIHSVSAGKTETVVSK